MRALDIIKKKRDGDELTAEEIEFFIKSIVAEEVSEPQIGYFLTALFCHGLSTRETADLTLAMAHSGKVLDLREIQGIKVDQPSTGGVGNKTPLIVPPMVAAAGVYVPKMSGWSLKHTGGTIDILESIGYNAELSIEQFTSNIKQVGLSNICQTDDLAPADGIMYRIRKETGTVENIPLIVSSILSKKIAIGVNAIVVDVKAGPGALLTDYNDTLKLAQELVQVGELAGLKTVAIITDNTQPQGRAVGNTLAIAEAIEVLKGAGPTDQRTICLELAANMLVLSQRVKDVAEGKILLKKLIAEGKAFEKFRELVKLHGGDVEKLDQPDLLFSAQFKIPLIAPQGGYIAKLNADEVNICARRLIFSKTPEGKEKLTHYDTGIIFHKKLGDEVVAGEEIATVHANDEALGREVKEVLLSKAYEFSKEQPVCPPLIHAIVMKNGVEVEREITAIIAFVKAHIDGEDKYLLQYNQHWGCYNFISGKEEREDDGDLNRTAAREVSEELALAQGDEFTVKELPIQIIEMIQFSKRRKVYTKYRFKLFQVFFKKPFNEINSSFLRNHYNRWFSEEEIQSGKGRDNASISETASKVVQTLRDKLRLLPSSFSA